MSGFDDWVEIFKGGKQTDADGNEHDGDSLIDNAINTFDPATMEPPLVVGHPEDNSPSFGWVQELKEIVIDGIKRLMMKTKDVVPEFAELVEKNIYKKRSASFFPDGRLRHVGFLGGAIPAVKGLADMKFNNTENLINFEFSMKKKEKKIMEFTQEQMDTATKAAVAIEKARNIKAIEAAKAEVRKEAKAEFAEKERKTALENKKVKTREKLKEFQEKSNIPPAIFITGISEFLDSSHATSFDFKESDGEKKQISSDWFLSFLENMDKVMKPLAKSLKKEVATKDKTDEEKDKETKEAEEDEKMAKDISDRVKDKKDK